MVNPWTVHRPRGSFAIMMPERRPHDWIEHKSPKCMECRTCKKVVGWDPLEEMTVELYGCTVLKVRREG